MCKKLVFTSASVWCSLYLLNVVMAVHRKFSRREVEPRWGPIVSLLRPFSSLAFRWPCTQPTNSTLRQKQIVSARISVGSLMESHTNQSRTLLTITIWEAAKESVLCDGNGRVNPITRITTVEALTTHILFGALIATSWLVQKSAPENCYIFL